MLSMRPPNVGIMKNRYHIVFTVFFASLCVLSCSVKENREPCPCYLEITFPQRNEVTHGVGLSAWHSKFLFFDDIDLGDYPDVYLRAVERQELVVCAYTGRYKALRDERKMMIPFGSQCDSLYSFYKEVDCSGENASCEVNFLKQFATVTVDIRKSAAEMQHYSMKASGNTCGFDLLSFTPVLGPFECNVTPLQNDYVFRFRIPRQVDSSLLLTLAKDGRDICEYPLGRLIELTGYDWTDPDLHDIFVSIDHTVSILTIRVEDWDYEENFDLKQVIL